MKTTVQILEEARELLSDESRWTKGAVARKKSGEPVLANHPEACSFCTLGAIDKVSEGSDVYYTAVATLQKLIGQSLSFFNDAQHRKHSEILKVLEESITLAKVQECS